MAQPRKDKILFSASDQVNGVQASGGAEAQKSASSFSAATSAPKVQLRNQRVRQMSRPISMPLDRLPAPAQFSERHNRNTSDSVDGSPSQRDTETIQEMPEPEKTRQSGSSRVSTYYITPFIDTQTMQRRTWDKKYKHYQVTPRTAMIVANLPPSGSGPQPVKTTVSVTISPTTSTASLVSTRSSVSTIYSSNVSTVSDKPVRTFLREKSSEDSANESTSSPKLPLTLRAPRTLQPPPGTFYKPPVSNNCKAWTLPSWTSTTVSPSSLSPTSSALSLPSSPCLTQARHQTQDSTDSAIDPGVSTSPTISPPQSPPPSSPDDLSPVEAKPRLRPRHLEEHEHREAHFV